MWRAIENAQKTVADGGLFYIALYSADADFQPSKEFWLEVKQAYNTGSSLKKLYMVYWYVWRFGMQRELKRLPEVVRRILNYRLERGMNYFADVRDWLGGWPMEYAGDQETVDLLEKKHGFRLVNLKTGEACSEFLFERTGSPEQVTCVKEFDQTKRRIASTDQPGEIA
jgi:2-polyprenyl-6-hydroxyphenyl methylase/3-demethylubiquinone-9 3-methyltransferase